MLCKFCPQYTVGCCTIDNMPAEDTDFCKFSTPEYRERVLRKAGELMKQVNGLYDVDWYIKRAEEEEENENLLD
ncbi:MAG: hypothetical protein JRI54_00090 [Deltaproteobacteria bacterium]|nr:hypothetical protein [Deltaproteobacteria bacterium]